MEENSYGNKHWYKDGKLHREDGPAIEYSNGSKHWHQNGKRHREDGPAVEYVDGGRHWYLNDVYLTEEEHRIQVDSLEFDRMIRSLVSR